MNPSSYRPSHPSQLPPLEATLLPDSEGTDRGLMWRGCALVVFLAALGAVAIVGLAYTLLRGPQALVWKHETPVEKRQNLRAAYSPVASVNHPDRRSIERFLARVANTCSKQDHQAFRALVDFDALYARVLAHPELPSLNALTRFQLKGQLEAEEVLGPISRLRLVSVHSFDANHVLAYTIADLPFGSQPWRLWLERSGNTWKLADWEQVDFGYSTSDRCVLAQVASLDPQYGQYQLSEVYVRQAQRLRGEGQRREAVKQLQAAAACPMPAVIADVQRYLIVAEWSEMHEPRQVVALCKDMDPAGRIPGVQWHLASALEIQGQWEGALQAATAYENAAGFQPLVVEIRARALEKLGREPEALAHYEQLQKFTPANVELLSNLYRLLPAERKSEWLHFVKQTPNPTQVAVQQASILLQQHDDVTLARDLEKFVASQAAGSAEHLQIEANLLEHEGDLAEAAAKYRLAAELPGTEDEQRGAWWKYFSAMHQAGLALEAFRTHPRPDEAFRYYVGGFEDDEAMVSSREIRPLVAAQLERNPDHPLANYAAAVFAQRDGDLAKAKEYLQRVKPAEEADEDDEDYVVAQAEYTLIEIAVQEGRALETLTASAAEDRSSTYQQLAGICLERQDWPTLQRLNDALRSTPAAEGNAWFRYYEAQLAIHDQQFDRAVQQMLLAKMSNSDPDKTPGEYYLEHLESEVLADAYGLLEAYRKHPSQKNAFARYQQQALDEHDLQTAAELCEAHRVAHPEDPALLTAEWDLALRQGQYERVVTLLTPWPELERFENQWAVTRAKQALVVSLLRLNRFDAALVAEQADGQSDAKLAALVYLARGDAAKLQAHVNKHQRQFPQLLADLAREHPHEFAAARNDARLSEMLRDFALPLRDEFQASLVLLSREEATWTIANLQEEFAAALPGTTIGDAYEHDAGASYDVKIPGVTDVRVQLTIGPEPYVDSNDLGDYVQLTGPLRDAVRAHRSWLSIEMTSSRTAAEADGPWQKLRMLLGAILDERVVAFGYREPASYAQEFCLAGPGLPELLRKESSLAKALNNLPSSFLSFGGLAEEEPNPSLTKELKRLARQYRAKAAPPNVQVRVLVQQGHRRESAWLRLVSVERNSYFADQYVVEPLSDSAGKQGSLGPGKYQVWAHEIREVRSGP